MYVHHVCALCLRRSEESSGSPGIGTPSGCEPQCGCWGQNLGALSVEPSVQALAQFLFIFSSLREKGLILAHSSRKQSIVVQVLRQQELGAADSIRPIVGKERMVNAHSGSVQDHGHGHL